MNLDNNLIRVSAIITTHNRLTDLKKAIDSVKQQTFPIAECIVVDDASDDDTFQWMNNAKDNWLKYIRIEKKDSKGGNHARNLGYLNSTSEYVAYLDDDDVWLPEKIEKQVSEIMRNPEYGLVYCGRIYKSGEKNETIIIPDKYYTGDLKTKIFTKVIATTSTFLIKKKLLDDIGGFDEKLKFWQETDMVIRLCQITSVACVFEPLVIYYAIPSANRLSTKYYDWIETVNYIRKKYERQINNLSDDERKKFELMYRNDAVNRCNSVELKKERKKHLYAIYKLQPSVKNFIIYFLNLDNIKKAKILHLLAN